MTPIRTLTLCAVATLGACAGTDPAPADDLDLGKTEQPFRPAQQRYLELTPDQPDRAITVYCDKLQCPDGLRVWVYNLDALDPGVPTPDQPRRFEPLFHVRIEGAKVDGPRETDVLAIHTEADGLYQCVEDANSCEPGAWLFDLDHSRPTEIYRVTFEGLWFGHQDDTAIQLVLEPEWNRPHTAQLPIY
jgi:hypothetical protein